MDQARINGDVRLRPASARDEQFLRALYESTREEELALVPWSEEQRRQFLDFQFEAQRAHYLEHHPNARHDVILCGDERAGRLYVEHATTEIRVIDIALMPGFRGQGIASALLGEAIEEAGRGQREVVIFVEQGNRARRLYERLGFAQSGELGIHLEMRWRPGQARSATRRQPGALS